jgi:hypothetical protein
MSWEACQGLQATAVRQLLGGGGGGHGDGPSVDGAAELCTCIHPHVSAAAAAHCITLLLQLTNSSILHASDTNYVGEKCSITALCCRAGPGDRGRACHGAGLFVGCLLHICDHPYLLCVVHLQGSLWLGGEGQPLGASTGRVDRVQHAPGSAALVSRRPCRLQGAKTCASKPFTQLPASTIYC